MNDAAVQPPFGFPLGPSLTTAELIARFVAGAREGHSPDAQIEDAVLVCGDEPLAIRLDGAMLVRDRAPAQTAGLWVALCRALEAGGMTLVERDTPLALIVESEVFARRGYEWGLWAGEATQGRAALAARAAGEMPGILEAHEAKRHDDAWIDAAALREMEEEL